MLFFLYTELISKSFGERRIKMLDFLIDAVCTIADIFIDFFVEKILRRKRKKKNKENENGETNGEDNKQAEDRYGE